MRLHGKGERSLTSFQATKATSPVALFGSNVNLIPGHSTVQASRSFYGSKFFSQAIPPVEPEAPLVQSMDETGGSLYERMGEKLGAIRADSDGVVLKATPQSIEYRTPGGETKTIELYDKFKFNRKTYIDQTPLVKEGDNIFKGDVLAKSNFTDNNGHAAVGLNATVAVVPYEGYSMDDAVVVTEPFARRMGSSHNSTHAIEYDNGVQGGKQHYASLFPSEFKDTQLDKLDDNGVVKPGTILEKGDPIILATQPKRLTASPSETGSLSKGASMMRRSAAEIWEHDTPGTVVDVVDTKKGKKAVVMYTAPLEEGDKIVFRSGQKGIVSRIIPERDAPRTESGQTVDVLLNPLGLPSRANNALTFELALGKAAKAAGKPLVVPAYAPKGTRYIDMVREKLAEHGLTEKERLYDPAKDIYTANPVNVGTGYIMKLIHMVDHKSSSRSTGAYDVDEQPLKGGSEEAKAKRLSGLETAAMLSASAYHNIREGATLRGQRNDEYWRTLRAGYTPAAPGKPFVWDKFQAMLSGSGLLARNLGDGKLRLGPMTDKTLEAYRPIEIENGELVEPGTMKEVPGGLFDPRMVVTNRWGKISLPHPVPNPAFEGAIASLLGITQKKLQAVLDGTETLEE